MLKTAAALFLFFATCAGALALAPGPYTHIPGQKMPPGPWCD